MIFAFALVTLLALGAAAYQGWRIVEAIVQAERVAVVPWPTRDASLLAPALEPAQATSTPAPAAPEPTEGAAAAVSGAVPTWTPSSREAPPVPAPTQTPALAQGGNASHFGVLREMVGVGTDDGDPGRSPVWGGRESLTILVVGIDRRDEGGDQNADVLMIAHVDLINKRVAAVSIPRDLLVEIPGIGPDKINSSYNYGVLANPGDPGAGVGKVRDTIESVFGVTLDGYVLIDFDGFEAVVDSIGGVDVDVPYRIVDEAYPTEDFGTEVVIFEPGLQHMDGDRALKYVRTRHGDDDDARRQRQYQVLLALFDTGKQLTSVRHVDDLISALGDSVQTSFPFEQQLTLARLGAQVERTNIRLSSLAPPLLEPGYTADGRWVYIGDLPTIVAFVQDALRTDAEYMTAVNGVAPPADT